MSSTALAADKTFDAGSLVIPMDLSYQSTGMFQAYGLVYQLLAHGVHVYWIIDPNKTWRPATGPTSALTRSVDRAMSRGPAV